MGIEYECRRLNIKLDEMCLICEKIGARYVGVYVQRRYVYDFLPPQKGRWIRLRTNGNLTTLTIKEIKSLRIDGTKELEVEVSDFDETNVIMNKLGYKARTYQENFRMEYKLGGITFDIDKWPGIPPYIEIEGEHKEDVELALNKLGWTIDDVTVLDVDKIYNEIYGINLDSIKYLQFTDDENNLIKNYMEKNNE